MITEKKDKKNDKGHNDDMTGWEETFIFVVEVISTCHLIYYYVFDDI